MSETADPLIETLGARGLADDSIGARTIRKLDRRVLLVCWFVAFTSYMDRGNLGFAAHDLCNALSLENKDYGLGVSLFYAGYPVSQVISNRLMLRLGPALVFSLIMCSWGLIAAAFGLIQNKTQFLVLRILLGIAEGGAFPGIWYYLSLFYPDKEVTRAMVGAACAVYFAIPVSSFVSAGLLRLDGFLDLEGWRWLFLVEGIVPVVLSIVLFFTTADSVENAPFLDQEEKRWIGENQKPADKAPESVGLLESLKVILGDVRWWMLMMPLTVAVGVKSVMEFWTALLIQEELYGKDDDSKSCGSAHGSATAAIVLTAVPFSLIVVSIFLWRKIKITNRPRFSAVVRLAAGTALASFALSKRIGFVAGYMSLCLAFFLESGSLATILATAISLFDRSLVSTAASFTNMTCNLGPLFIPVAAAAILDEVGYGWTVLALALLSMAFAFMLFLVRDPLMDRDFLPSNQTSNSQTLL